MSQPEKNILDLLLEGTDYGAVLTEQQKQKVTQLINETVDSRVTAKEKLLSESFAQKETELTESFKKQKEKLEAKIKDDEKTLILEAENFKKTIEATTLKEAQEFKNEVEKKVNEKAELYKNELDGILIKEAKDYKEKQDKALVEEVQKFKDTLIERVSDYLEAKLQECIPSETLEAATKLSVYEPLVQSIMEGFSRNYVKLDDTSYQLIKESKNELARLENELQTSKKQIVSLTKEKKEVERNYKIKSLTEGLTEVQKSKATKLLEGVETDKLDTQYKQIQDIIVESATVETPKTKTLVEKEDKTIKDTVKLQSKPVQESTVVKMQQTKILKESTELIKPEPKKSEPSDSDKTMQKWSNRITPGYAK
jgi:hypothetical protein